MKEVPLGMAQLFINKLNNTWKIDEYYWYLLYDTSRSDVIAFHATVSDFGFLKRWTGLSMLHTKEVSQLEGRLYSADQIQTSALGSAFIFNEGFMKSRF